MEWNRVRSQKHLTCRCRSSMSVRRPYRSRICRALQSDAVVTTSQLVSWPSAYTSRESTPVKGTGQSDQLVSCGKRAISVFSRTLLGSGGSWPPLRPGGGPTSSAASVRVSARWDAAGATDARSPAADGASVRTPPTSARAARRPCTSSRMSMSERMGITVSMP